MCVCSVCSVCVCVCVCVCGVCVCVCVCSVCVCVFVCVDQYSRTLQIDALCGFADLISMIGWSQAATIKPAEKEQTHEAAIITQT